jgi:hypothetical protein
VVGRVKRDIYRSWYARQCGSTFSHSGTDSSAAGVAHGADIAVVTGRTAGSQLRACECTDVRVSETVGGADVQWTWIRLGGMLDKWAIKGLERGVQRCGLKLVKPVQFNISSGTSPWAENRFSTSS